MRLRSWLGRLTVAIAAASVVVTPLLVPSSAPPAVAAPVSEDTVVLAAGTVVVGDVPQAGATVVVEQSPEDLVGNSNGVKQLGTVQSDSAGRWELRIPRGQFPRSEDNSPDLHISAVAGDRYAVTNKPALDPASPEGAQKVASDATLADAASLDLNGATSFALGSSAAGSKLIDAITRNPSVNDEENGVPCGWVTIRNLPWTNVYFTHIWTDSQTRGRVIQDISSTHEMGVEVGKEDKYGGFTAGGTASRTSSAGFNTNFTVYNQAIGNTWSYILRRYSCAGVPGSVHYEASPIRAEGGPVYTPTNPPSWCVKQTTYPAGTEFNRSSGEGHGIATTGDVMGARVSAQSGWDTRQTISFHFYYPGRVCTGSSVGIYNALYVRADR